MLTKQQEMPTLHPHINTSNNTVLPYFVNEALHTLRQLQCLCLTNQLHLALQTTKLHFNSS